MYGRDGFCTHIPVLSFCFFFSSLRWLWTGYTLEEPLVWMSPSLGEPYL